MIGESGRCKISHIHVIKQKMAVTTGTGVNVVRWITRGVASRFTGLGSFYYKCRKVFSRGQQGEGGKMSKMIVIARAAAV